MIYLYAYDIPDNWRRTKIAKKLEQYGIRIQKSVFQCGISAGLSENLKRSLQRLINTEEDNLLIIPLCQNDLEKVECLGVKIAIQHEDEKYIIL
jgi:CRISPR-associated protein Cas2